MLNYFDLNNNFPLFKVIYFYYFIINDLGDLAAYTASAGVRGPWFNSR